MTSSSGRLSPRERRRPTSSLNRAGIEERQAGMNGAAHRQKARRAHAAQLAECLRMLYTICITNLESTLNFSSAARSLSALVLSVALAACGGGGGSDAAVAPVSASSMAPSTAAPGVTVTVSGAGLSRVTSVAVGGIAATFKLVSDTELTVTVPDGVSTASASVTLSGAGFSTQVQSSLTLDMPTLASLSASAAELGDSVTITGARLDTVKTFSVGGVQLAASSVTPTSATLVTPMTPVSGAIVLTDSLGHSFTTSYKLATHAPLLISTLSTAVAVVGDSVTIYGTGLDAVTAVAFDNGAAAAISSQSAASLTFVVPAQAAVAGGSAKAYTSALTLTTSTGHATSAATLTVGASLSIGKTDSSTDGFTSTVSITGTNLSLVNGATVGGVAASVKSATDSLLTLLVPGQANGVVLLSTLYQTGVPAGTVSTSNTGVATTLSELDFAQVLNKAGTDKSLRLTPLRPVLARAFVVTTKTGTSSPVVSLQVTNGSMLLGTLRMTGPATIPTKADAYSASSTYNTTVPAAWVTQGVTFKVAVAGAAAQTVSASPAVGAAAKMHIVVVPLNIGGVTATLPSLSQVHDVFARVYPLASDSITVTARAQFSVTVASAINSTSDANAILAQLETLRALEDPNAFYYGFFADSINSTTLGGLGYVGLAGNAKSSAETAIGYDASYQFIGIDSFGLKTPAWAQVMLHEIGHNNSLDHAPCGNPSGVDASYPYIGGVLGAQALYSSLYSDDATVGAIANPVTSGGTMTDLMGYCSGIFFSDYNYGKVQAYAEARTVAVPAPTKILSAQVGADTAPSGYLVISGSLSAKGVTLHPALATSTAPAANVSNDSPYTLRITTDAGQTLSYPVLVHAVADSENGAAYFARTIPNPGPIATVEVLRGGSAMASTDNAGATRMRAASAGGTGESTRVASWSETAGMLHLSWNSASEPFASVMHVSNDGTRTVVALRLEGGNALVDVKSLPAGGKFEIAFSSVTSARLVTVQR
jgi:hypothetical protein